MKKIVCIFWIAAAAITCHGQTSGWSNYNQVPYLQNAAFSGIEKYTDLKAAFKKHWTSFPGAPKTYFAGASMGADIKNKGLVKVTRPVRLGLAGYLSQTSYNAINDFQLGLSYAVHIPVSSTYYLSFGISTRYSRSKSQIDDLVVRDLQDPFYQSLQSNAGRINYFDMDAGLALYSSKLYVAYAPQQLIRTRFASDLPGNERSNIAHTLLLGYICKMSKAWELQPTLLLRHQASLKDYYNVVVKVRYDARLWAGLCYSQQEYVSLITGFKVSSHLAFNYAYDFSVGKTRSMSQGSHEVMLGVMPFNKKDKKAYLW